MAGYLSNGQPYVRSISRRYIRPSLTKVCLILTLIIAIVTIVWHEPAPRLPSWFLDYPFDPQTQEVPPVPRSTCMLRVGVSGSAVVFGVSGKDRSVGYFVTHVNDAAAAITSRCIQKFYGNNAGWLPSPAANSSTPDVDSWLNDVECPMLINDQSGSASPSIVYQVVNGDNVTVLVFPPTVPVIFWNRTLTGLDNDISPTAHLVALRAIFADARLLDGTTGHMLRDNQVILTDGLGPFPQGMGVQVRSTSVRDFITVDSALSSLAGGGSQRFAVCAPQAIVAREASVHGLPTGLSLSSSSSSDRSSESSSDSGGDGLSENETSQTSGKNNPADHQTGSTSEIEKNGDSKSENMSESAGMGRSSSDTNVGSKGRLDSSSTTSSGSSSSTTSSGSRGGSSSSNSGGHSDNTGGEGLAPISQEAKKGEEMDGGNSLSADPSSTESMSEGQGAVPDVVDLDPRKGDNGSGTEVVPTGLESNGQDGADRERLPISSKGSGEDGGDPTESIAVYSQHFLRFSEQVVAELVQENAARFAQLADQFFSAPSIPRLVVLVQDKGERDGLRKLARSLRPPPGFPSIDFVDASAMIFSDILEQILNATALLSLHGPGLVNAMYLPQGAVVVELAPTSAARNHAYRSLIELTGKEYVRHFFGEVEEEEGGRGKREDQSSDKPESGGKVRRNEVSLDPRAIQDLIDVACLLGINNHLVREQHPDQGGNAAEVVVGRQLARSPTLVDGPVGGVGLEAGARVEAGVKVSGQLVAGFEGGSGASKFDKVGNRVLGRSRHLLKKR